MASLRPRALLRQAPRDLLYVGLSGPIGLMWLIVIVVIFLLLQRYFVNGLAGAVKG